MTRIFCRNKEGRERGRDSQEKARKVRLFCIRYSVSICGETAKRQDTSQHLYR